MTRRRRAPSRAPDDTQTLTGSPFEIAPSMADGEDTGSVRLGPFERLYESLFAEALEGGEISAQERERLNLAAKALGLDADRVEAASARAVELGVLNCKGVAALLARKPDAAAEDAGPATLFDHPNLRGPRYYN